jgi:hypothetical protein
MRAVVTMHAGDDSGWIEGEFVVYGGGAKPTDTHLACIIHGIDDDIFDLLRRRERRKGSRANPDNHQGHREANTHCTAKQHREILPDPEALRGWN